MKKRLAAFAVLGLVPGLARTQETKPLLLQKPAVNQTHIVFSYAGDLWIAPRSAGPVVPVLAMS